MLFQPWYIKCTMFVSTQKISKIFVQMPNETVPSQKKISEFHEVLTENRPKYYSMFLLPNLYLLFWPVFNEY